jgi:hypothetical protein
VFEKLKTKTKKFREISEKFKEGVKEGVQVLQDNYPTIISLTATSVMVGTVVGTYVYRRELLKDYNKLWYQCYRTTHMNLRDEDLLKIEKGFPYPIEFLDGKIVYLVTKEMIKPKN